MRKSSRSLLLLGALTIGAGCGASDEATHRMTVGLEVAGSVRHGFAVAALSSGPSLPAGRLDSSELSSGKRWESSTTPRSSRSTVMSYDDKDLGDVELGGIPYAAALIPKPEP